MILRLLILLSTLLTGETLDSDKIAPPARAYDPDRLFKYASAELAEISEQLDGLSRDFGFSIYIAMFQGLIGTDVTERALYFREHWLPPGQDGLVIVFNSDSYRVAYASAHPPERYHPKQQKTSFILEDHEITPLISRIQEKIDQRSSYQDCIIAFSRELEHELRVLLTEKSQPPKRFSFSMLTSIILASSGVIALIALSTWLTKRTQTRSLRKSAFPEIEVPERLGASFSGGQGWSFQAATKTKPEAK